MAKRSSIGGPSIFGIETLESRRLLSAVTSLAVVHASNGSTIQALTEGDTLDAASIAKGLSVRAFTSPSTVGSVVFNLDGKIYQTENAAPYAIRGDVGSAYNPWAPTSGNHTLVVTPYSGAKGAGTAGTAKTVHFTVGSSNPTPTPAPTPSPTLKFPKMITQWTTVDPSPVVRAEAVGGVVGGKLYVLGGFDNEGSQDTSIPLTARADVFDPSAAKGHQWTRLRDMPERFTHSQEVIVGTDMWFIGGYVGNHPGPGTTNVYIYHTATDTWSHGPSLPVARGAGAAALVDHTIYFTGGLNASRTVDEGTTYALDLNKQSAGWVKKADLPNPRNHVAAASVGGYFYVLGGQHGQEDAQVSQSEVDRYDPKTNTWTKVASLPGGRSHITEATLVYNGRIVVIGGETASGTQQKSIFDYDPAANKWYTLGALPAARSTTVSGFINGKLVVSTGNGPGATTTTWVATLG